MTLTPRELEAMQHIANGLTREQAGHAMGISSRTVNNYASSAMSKLGAQSCISAVAMLISRGMIEAPKAEEK